MSLITKRDKKVRYVPPFDELTLLVFGIPGSGKTSFCSGASDAVFASTEPGAEFVHTSFDPISIPNWAKFKEVVAELANAKKEGKELGVGAVTIDIVDNLSTMCRDFVCGQAGLAYPPENDFGKTWSAINKEWTGWNRALLNLTKVRYVSHCTTEQIEVTNDAGIKEIVTRYLPTFSRNKSAQYLDGIVNAVGYCTQNKANVHTVTFAQSPSIASKDRTGILGALGEIALPQEPSKSWEHVASLYAAKANELGFTLRSLRS